MSATPIAASDRLRAICATLAPQGSDVNEIANAAATALATLDAAKRRRFEAFLMLLGLHPLVASHGGGWNAFEDASPAQRETVLLRLAESPLPPLRMGYLSVKRLVHFMAYAGSERMWAALHYAPAEPPNPLGGPLEVLPTQVLSGRREADVVVVGSGAGGGLVAAALAAAGKRVVVVEAGPLWNPAGSNRRELDAFRSLYLENGACSSSDLGMCVLAGSCLGGGTTINWCTSLRLREPVATEWSELVGWDVASELEPHYDAIHEQLGLTPVLQHNAQNDIILRGAEALEWSRDAMPRNAAATCGRACGSCGFGCAYGNKRSTTENYLRTATEQGAVVYVDSPVRRVVIEDDMVRGVAGEGFEVRAPLVVLAAGSLRTPAILGESGVRSAALGRHLHLHPVSAIVAEFDEPVRAWEGPMQSAYCDEFAADFMIETAPTHPGLSGQAMPWRGREQYSELMKHAEHWAALIALVRDRDSGSVGTKGATPDLHYSLSEADGERLLRGLEKTAQLALAAGARRVMTLHHAGAECRAGEPIEWFWRRVRELGYQKHALPLFSAHQMGSARMHISAEQGVCDPSGRVRGTKGLWVADASLFPAASGVNPMLTIFAMARRVARYILS
jgi:choline dehydrogenase-like flavoprotein